MSTRRASGPRGIGPTGCDACERSVWSNRPFSGTKTPYAPRVPGRGTVFLQFRPTRFLRPKTRPPYCPAYSMGPLARLNL